MFRRVYLVLVVLCLPLLAPLVATAQEEEPTIYTYIAHFGVPRAQWAEFTAFGEENARPVLERMFADGAILAWGNSVPVVHQEGGPTHEVWWTATSIAGIERVREELVKLPPNPAAANATHHDHLLRSIVYRGSTTGPTSGYLWVTAVKVRPGRSQQWRAVWEKYFKPTYDELLANGTILAYNVSAKYVHDEDPRWRFIAYVAPSAGAEDKVDAAFTAVFQKEAPAIFAALSAVAIRSEHRDFFRRVLNYAHK